MAFTAVTGRTHALNLFMKKCREMVNVATKEAVPSTPGQVNRDNMLFCLYDMEEFMMPKQYATSASIGAIGADRQLGGTKCAGKPAINFLQFLSWAAQWTDTVFPASR